jgi:hypothetical protein
MMKMSKGLKKGTVPSNIIFLKAKKMDFARRPGCISTTAMAAPPWLFKIHYGDGTSNSTPDYFQN